MPFTTSREPEIEPDFTASVAPNEVNTLRDRYDPTDNAFQGWFSAPAKRLSGMNEVVGYVRGTTLLADIGSAIRTATSEKHFVLIAGWASDLTCPLDRGASLSEVLESVASGGVAVRALLYLHLGATFGGAFNNQPLVDLLNDKTKIPNGAAIHDSRHLNLGSHHQKLIIVSGTDGLIAFVGGNDLMPDRLVIHDTHLRVRGPAAGDLFLSFTERWFEHPAVKALSPAPAPIPQPLPSKDVKETRFVQVGRTYGNGSAHDGIDVDAQGNKKGYSFAPQGAREVEAMTLHAIQKAKTFIYLEDQYLVSPTISAALAAAIPRLTFMLILMCPTANVNKELKKPPLDFSQYRRRRQDFLEPILAAGPDKLFVFDGYGASWMHSKLWIIDDKLALVGSANVNNRGYTHDSEVLCSVFDPNPTKKWFFAHEMRMHLWAKHLGGQPIDFRDPVFSLARWKRPAPSDEEKARKGELDEGGFGSETAWGNLIDPDGS
jgi:hypothetical protein